MSKGNRLLVEYYKRIEKAVRDLYPQFCACMATVLFDDGWQEEDIEDILHRMDSEYAKMVEEERDPIEWCHQKTGILIERNKR